MRGDFGAGAHMATINFINDAWGGTAATDRNLFVEGAAINGAASPNAALMLLSGGPQGFWFATAAVAAGAGVPDTLDIQVSEDAWQGDAQFTVAIDGATVGGTRTATASHAAGSAQTVSIQGGWGAGGHTVQVAFINDAWGGTAATDRNLYVGRVAYNGVASADAPASLLSAGSASFAVGTAPKATALALHLAEDAWQGDARYSISVDGGPAV